MKYQITFREINELDINSECRYLPDFDEFVLHVQAITEDINGLFGVINVDTHEQNRIIVTTQDIDLENLKLQLKPLLTKHYEYIRIVANESFLQQF